MSDDLTDAARRGLQRAGVHLMNAALEVVEGISVFLEELGRDVDSEKSEDDGPGDKESE